MSFNARLLRIAVIVWLAVGIFMAVPIASGPSNQVFTPLDEVCSVLGLSGVPMYEGSIRGWMARRTSSLCTVQLKNRTDREVLVVLTVYEASWSLLVLGLFFLVRRAARYFR